jgi:hypothetical protein
MFFQVFLASSCECGSGIKGPAPNVKTPIHLSYSLHEVPPKFFFFFCFAANQLTNLIDQSPKTNETIEAPQNRR